MSEQNVDFEVLAAKNLIRDYLAREFGKDQSYNLDDEPLNAIPIGFTNTTDELMNLQAYADLENRIFRLDLQLWLDDSPEAKEWTIIKVQYETMAEMIDFLAGMEFDSIISISDADWCHFHESSIGRQWMKDTFPAGTRIKLDAMYSDPFPVPGGTLGTVHHVDDGCNIHMTWDNGRTLALLYGIDQFYIIKEVQK